GPAASRGRCLGGGHVVKTSRAIPAVLVGLLVAAIVPATATANTERVSDPNDVKGLLDFHYSRAGHAGTSITQTLVTYGSWSSTILKKDGFFAIGFDTNNHIAEPERWV